MLDHSNLKLSQENGRTVIDAPADVHYDAPLTMRPDAVKLLGVLEAGAIDCVFIYKSVALQHKLDYLDLPDEVNLGNPALAEQYDVVRARENADRPDKAVLVAATPIVYGFTIPRSAPHPKRALEFARLLLSDTGRRIMQDNGQTPIEPAVYSPASRTDGAPFDLRKLQP